MCPGGREGADWWGPERGATLSSPSPIPRVMTRRKAMVPWNELKNCNVASEESDLKNAPINGSMDSDIVDSMMMTVYNG